jgi:hypothetical protein
MSRCLGDRTLWLLSEGEASREDRAHVVSCVICAARLQRLEQTLHCLQSVLTGPPPPGMALAQPRHVRRRWMASAVALAAMVMLAWFGVWWQQPLPSRSMGMRQESIWPFTEGVSTAPLSTVEIGFGTTADGLADLDDLQAALAGEWPCEGPEVPSGLACDDDTFALLLGEL